MNIWEIHPALVHFPLAFLLGGVALDLFGKRSEVVAATATYLLVAGLVAAALAAVSGVVAFYTAPANHTEEAHRLVYWHIGLNVAAVILFTVICFVRWPRPSVVSPAIRWAGVAAAIVLIAGGAVGGRLVYHGGLGVNPDILKPNLHAQAAAADSAR